MTASISDSSALNKQIEKVARDIELYAKKEAQTHFNQIKAEIIEELEHQLNRSLSELKDLPKKKGRPNTKTNVLT